MNLSNVIDNLVRKPFRKRLFKKKIAPFRNKHKGESCIIMGAGPSLKDLPVEVLKKFTVIGTNSSYKHYVPDYNVIVDAQFSWLDEALKALRNKGGVTFINLIWNQDKRKLREKLTKNDIELFHFETSADHSMANVRLWNRLSDVYNNPFKIEEGVTSVTSVVPEGAIPLALYMGFDKIYLIGVDFTNSYGHHFFKDDKEDLKKIVENEKNIQNISNSSKGLWEMKIYPFELISYSKNKNKIINLSKISEIKTIQKKSIESFINELKGY
ncbi:6-hydroxymethylpterin diphosphokinase MptE-like protein [Algibacter mikhailovii]|uniref:6-hydroxymethylpterin diphosphokinase MptE-like domain-containing protein n=1 Tax=Algibacter mikhailovii TaxID=425498 RepID=A0A918V7H7_9FLAO|nr:6-hydroxymethylpterin diphosphokinase MptE-like protein [Algibacter mikhailovii]GGZ76675.1 hypothetical protein GCM10007028_12380 [Algibacter mikhailovii]